MELSLRQHFKDTFLAVRTMSQGRAARYCIGTHMQFCKNNGVSSSAVIEMVRVLIEYFCEVRRRTLSVNWDSMSKITCLHAACQISGHLTFVKLNNAANKIDRCKVPDWNGATPKINKTLNELNRLNLLKLTLLWLLANFNCCPISKRKLSRP